MPFQYSCEVKHIELGKYRVVSGTDRAIVEAKARALQQTWEKEYQRKRAKEEQLKEKERWKAIRARAHEERQGNAEERTEVAKEAIEEVQNLLCSSLEIQHAIEWEELKQSASYSTPQPSVAEYLKYPVEPKPDDAKYTPSPFTEVEPQAREFKYQPTLTMFDKLVKARVDQKTQEAYQLYITDHLEWTARKQNYESETAQRAKEKFLADHAEWRNYVPMVEAENQRRYAEAASALEAWDSKRLEFVTKQKEENAQIDKLKAEYESLSANAVVDYCELVLSASEYPDYFSKESNLEYISETKILLIDYSLPAPEHMPRIKEVKYIKTKDELVEIPISDSEFNRIYDGALYQVCLRTLHELFEADEANAIAAIVFNGWVKSIDRATGKETNGCILSIQVKKDEFQNINLKNVEPKTCFKSLKGVGSSQLHSLTPVAPVLKLNREDKRFIASKDVAGILDERYNLAAMDWEDFEQLIRELFEKEFNSGGGEVKVTQASRDGGVDAVAFDPDPIHGGKIVIQAKRYTNTVGVGFVRELWGTVLNEGAMKGILITTADYGPDAYEFAKGKPLTLMNGNNLLYLLEKHGHKAKIDIKEAKRILGEKI